MSKRILLAWEIGGGMGHQLKLSWIAAALQLRGHQPIFAVPHPERVSETDNVLPMHPSPRWPGKTARSTSSPSARSTGHVDDLGRFGFAVPGAFEAMLRGWDDILSETEPHAIVADSAPACLTAARGRIPTVAVGEGFSLPPSTMEQFPALNRSDQQPLFGEDQLLDAANIGLRAVGRRSLSRLSQLYSADRVGVGSFDELDPYREYRTYPNMSPWLPHWEGGADMLRQELFVYLSLKISARRTILIALARLAARGIPVTLRIPRLDSGTAAWLQETRIRTEARSLTLKEIQSRAAMILTFGSLGLVSFALAAGIPQIVIPYSAANRVTGTTIEELGVGRTIRLTNGDPFEPLLLAQAIEQTYSDSSFTERAKSLAPMFIHRAFPRTSERVAALVEELL